MKKAHTIADAGPVGLREFTSWPLGRLPYTKCSHSMLPAS